MPKRTVLQSITIGRGSERFTPEVGSTFDFTDEELVGLPEGAVSEMGTINHDDEQPTEAKGKGKAKPAGGDL